MNTLTYKRHTVKNKIANEINRNNTYSGMSSKTRCMLCISVKRKTTLIMMHANCTGYVILYVCQLFRCDDVDKVWSPFVMTV